MQDAIQPTLLVQLYFIIWHQRVLPITDMFISFAWGTDGTISAKITWICKAGPDVYKAKSSIQPTFGQVWQRLYGSIMFAYIVNPLHAKFIRVSINIYLHFMSFLHIDLTQVLKILPQVREGPNILHNQYHGCWCPGDVRSQGISSHDIDLVKPRWLGPRTLRVNCLEMYVECEQWRANPLLFF